MGMGISQGMGMGMGQGTSWNISAMVPGKTIYSPMECATMQGSDDGNRQANAASDNKKQFSPHMAGL